MVLHTKEQIVENKPKIEYYELPDTRRCSVKVYVNSVEIHCQYFKTAQSRKDYLKFMSLVLRHAGVVYFELAFYHQTRKTKNRKDFFKQFENKRKRDEKKLPNVH